MKVSTEFKLGITALATLAVIIWGINFLKGKKILNKSAVYTSNYREVEGIDASTSIYYKGFEVGSVGKVVFEQDNEPPFTVYLSFKKDFRIVRGSIAEIYDADLLGTRAIRIIEAGNNGYYSPGDTIPGRIASGLIEDITSELGPLMFNIKHLLLNLDSISNDIRKISGDESVYSFIANLEKSSAEIRKQLSAGGDLSNSLEHLESFTLMLHDKGETISQITENINGLSTSLKNAGLDSLVNHLNSVSMNIAEITASIQSGKGNLGKIMKEDSLYYAVSRLVLDLDSLVRDIGNDPKKYVGFSLIGK